MISIKDYFDSLFINYQISYFHKKSRMKVIAVDCKEPSLYSFIKPIIDLLKKDKNLVILLVCDYSWPVPIKDLSLKSSCYVVNSTFIDKLKNVDLYISPSIYGKLPPDSIAIHVSHNQPVKYLALPKDEFEKFDYHFVIGPLHLLQIKQTLKIYNLPYIKNKYVKIGYPKSDALYINNLNREDKIMKLGLNPKFKTIMYAPSWEKGLSLRQYGDEIFNVLLSLNNYNVIIKLHPVSYSDINNKDFSLYTGGINWKQRTKFLSKKDNVINVIDKDSEEYLQIADLMITDLSGIALEFLTLLKPIIYIDCPNFFRQNRELYKEYGLFDADLILNNPISNAGRDVGLVIKDLNKLPESIKYLFSHNNYKIKERTKRAKLLRYNPGAATIAAVRWIYKIIDQ